MLTRLTFARVLPSALASTSLLAACALASCVSTTPNGGTGASTPTGSASSGSAGSTSTSSTGGTGSGDETIAAETPWATDGIHVATTGDDASGDGTSAAPYRTIMHVLDNVATDGSTVLVHAGTYPEQVRIRRSNLLLQAVEGEDVRIAVPPTDDENAPIIALEVDAETQGVHLRGLDIAGGFYALYFGSYWEDNGMPGATIAAHDAVVEDCKLHDSGRDVVKLPSGVDRVTIRRSEIYNSGVLYPPGETDRNAEGVDAVNADSFYLADTFIHDTATTCVYVKGGSIGAVIERVRAERCGEMGIALGFDTSPEYFDKVANPGYYENIGGVIRNSYVRDTQWAGIALYASKDARVLHNTIVSSAQSAQAAIYFGVTLQDYEPSAGRPPNVNPTLVGNVVDQAGVPDARCAGIRFADENVGMLYGLEGALTMRDNLYFAGGAPCLFVDDRPASLLEAGDLAGWQAHGAGFDVGSRFLDPLLDGSGRPGDGSPALDVLDATPGVTFDLDKEKRSAPFDLGAFER